MIWFPSFHLLPLHLISLDLPTIRIPRNNTCQFPSSLPLSPSRLSLSGHLSVGDMFCLESDKQILLSALHCQLNFECYPYRMSILQSVCFCISPYILPRVHIQVHAQRVDLNREKNIRGLNNTRKHSIPFKKVKNRHHFGWMSHSEKTRLQRLVASSLYVLDYVSPHREG